MPVVGCSRPRYDITQTSECDTNLPITDILDCGSMFIWELIVIRLYNLQICTFFFAARCVSWHFGWKIIVSIFKLPIIRFIYDQLWMKTNSKSKKKKSSSVCRGKKTMLFIILKVVLRLLRFQNYDLNSLDKQSECRPFIFRFDSIFFFVFRSQFVLLNTILAKNNLFWP